jgi:hypothetical protein
MGSHQPSSQHAPIRGKTGTDSPYERGQIGEQVSIADEEVRIAQKDGWTLDVVVERFEAERYALQLSRLLFHWYESDDASKARYLEQMVEIIPVFRRFLARVEHRLKILTNNENDDEFKGQVPVSVRRKSLENLSLRALRNILAIGLQVSAGREEARLAWSKLQLRNSEDGSGVNRGSFMSEFLYTCGEALFGATPQLRRNARRQIDKNFRESHIRRRKVFPYDAPRFLTILSQIKAGV